MHSKKPKGKQLKELDITGLLKNISKQYDVNVKRVFHNEFLKSVLNRYETYGTLSERQVQGLVNMHNGIERYEDNGKQYKENYAAVGRSMKYERENNRKRSGYSSSKGYTRNYGEDAYDHPLNDIGSMGYLF